MLYGVTPFNAQNILKLVEDIELKVQNKKLCFPDFPPINGMIKSLIE